MWEEERFLLRLIPNSSHYLLCLSAGLLFFCWDQRTRLFHSIMSMNNLLFAVAIVAVFAFSLKYGAVGFVVAAALLTSLFLSVISSVVAVGVTTILYICRPWEVLEASEWWLQLPRWCIWIWVLSWMRSIHINERAFVDGFRFSRGIIAMFAMCLWALLTTILSRDSAGSLQYFIDTYLRAIVLVMIIQLTVRSKVEVQALLKAFAIGVTILSLFSLWRFHGLDQSAPLELIPKAKQQADARLEAVGSLGNSNDIAAVVTIALGVLWPLVLSKQSSLLNRVLSLVMLSLLLKTILASQSRGALIAAVAQCGIYFVAHSRSPARLGALLLVFVLATAPLANAVMGRHADDLDASTESRMNYYVTGLRMAVASPIWGQGFGRYPYEFDRFSASSVHEWGLRTAHSSWVLVLSETGLVGLLLFTWIHIRMFRHCWQLRRSEPGLLLALSGYSITILFLSHAWLMFPWILFALIEFRARYRCSGGCVNDAERGKSQREDSLGSPKASLASPLWCEPGK